MGQEKELLYSRRQGRPPRSFSESAETVGGGETAGRPANRAISYTIRLDAVTKMRRRGPERDLRVDNVRGILIILVVIGHFLLPFEQTRLINNLFYLIYSFHMPCFIMISGFYARTLYKKGYFRWGKVVQLLWLYFVYKMIVGVTEGLLAGEIPLFPDFLHESGAPWYLLALSFWYLTVPFFRRFREYPLNIIAICGVLLGVIGIKYLLNCGSFLSLDRVTAFAPFFYIGYYYNQENLDSYLASPARKYIDRIAALLALGIFLLMYDRLMRYNLVVYGAQYRRYDPALFPWLWLINLIWYLVAFLLSLGLFGITLNRRMYLLTALGQRSLQVYMLHRPIRDLMEYCGVYGLLNPHSKLTSVLVIAFSVLLSALLGSKAVYRWFQYLQSAPDRVLEKLGAL